MRYSFSMPSGRTIEVAVARGPAPGPDSVAVVFRARVTAGPDVGAQETAPITRTVNITAIAVGTLSLLDQHWRRWTNKPAPNTASNLQPPADLKVGDDRVVDGVRWIGGDRTPAKGLTAALGSCYADLAANAVYKRVRGHAEKLAEAHAQDYDRALSAQVEVDALPTAESLGWGQP